MNDSPKRSFGIFCSTYKNNSVNKPYVKTVLKYFENNSS